MENKDVRWKQRFQNFEKAFLFFQTAIDKDTYTPIEVGGLVQAFEFTFELGWKTIKDYLYEQGLNKLSPRGDKRGLSNSNNTRRAYMGAYAGKTKRIIAHL